MRTLLNVTVHNFLSFRRIDVALKPLNVLVGPNGAGKTNFLRVFQFLGDVARNDLVPAVDSLGGMEHIRFRTSKIERASTTIEVRGLITEHASLNAPDEYSLSFWQLRLRHGRLDSPGPRRMLQRRESIVLKRFRGRGRRITLSGGSMVFAPEKDARTRDERKISIQSQSSGLSTIRRLGEEYGASQVAELASVFEDLRLFEVDVEKARLPASAIEPSRLSADASNLAAYLQWMKDEYPDIFEKLCQDVRYVLPSFVSFEFSKLGGSSEAIVVQLKERYLTDLTPLGRASFGTIRAISLFAMLHDPSPPKLTCLEEVDHGLHPHALDRLVQRLREASDRTQIIVATHSPALVNRLQEDELCVFERDEETDATRVVDLGELNVSAMIEESGYGLGELWFSGTLGGAL
ncbi:MAG: AAA family ATPase [Phreatobacter sp.]|uniref:AAA family ATPase n=1 Tax=Phreatobacter sp. TaxID=1966341 RepID=UPI001A50D152|nr:AAA family ATPase [Phreatobacter sp.]MBL8571735.1 AAA family ATPase [Phreatobacter sp.]